jgi:hypothetical protein
MSAWWPTAQEGRAPGEIPIHRRSMGVAITIMENGSLVRPLSTVTVQTLALPIPGVTGASGKG